MIVWPAVVNKFLILDAGVTAAIPWRPPTHGRSAEADSKAAPGAAAVSRLGAERAKRSEIRYAVIKTVAEPRLAAAKIMRVVARASIESEQVDVIDRGCLSTIGLTRSSAGSWPLA